MSKTNGNGNGTSGGDIVNGHGNSTVERMRKMLADHEQAAVSIRHTLTLLGVDLQPVVAVRAKAANGNGHHAALVDALAIERAKKNHKKRPDAPGRGRKTKRTPIKDQPDYAAGKGARRAITGAILAAFGRKPMTTDQIRELPDVGAKAIRQLGPLTRHGYLEKHKDGSYMRTSVEFTP